MKAKKVAAVALTAAMTVSMAASVNVFAADGYDPADFKSDKDSKEWTIAVVTKDNMKEELVDTGYYTQDDDGYLHPAQ